MPNNEIPIPFDESRRGENRRLEVKALGRNLAARVAGRLVDRPNIGRGGRNRRNGGVDLPTGGKPGTRRPTGSNFDPDNDGWVDEGTTRPRFIGTAEQRKLSSSRRRQQQAPQLRQPPLRETSQASKERQAAKPRVLLTTLSSGRRDVTQWKRVGNQKGSNAGGFYEDENGDLFYVKWPKENLQSETEVLANKLYELADVEVPDVQVAQDSDGAKVVISEVIPNIKPVGPGNATDEQAEELASNFIFDAWLSNWDSVLSSNSNLTPDGRLVRIDSGGALIFRAQGARKGARFGEEVGEIDTMRDSDITEAGYIFGRLTDDGLTEQAGRLAKIDPRQVENLVRELVSDGAEAENLATILRARRTNILDRFGVADPYEGTSAGKLSSGQRKVTPELLERHRNTDYKYGDPSVIDGRPMRSSTRGWLSGLTGKQIANLLTPGSEEQAREMQADAILAQALFSAGTNMDSLSRKELQQLRERTKEQLSSIYGMKLEEMPDIEADYSEESTSAVRNMLSQAFIDVPGLLWAVQKFGAPPYLKSSQEGFRRRQEPNLLGTHVPGLGIMLSPPLFADGATGFDPQQPRKGNWMIDTSPSGVILHEWGHWFDSKLKTLSHFGSRSDSAYFSGQSSEQPKRGKFRLGRPKNEPMHPMLPSDHFDRSKFGEDTTDKTVSQQISSVLSDLRMLTSEESPFREMYETNRPLITETARLSQDGFDPSRYGFGMATGYGNASPTEMVAESFVAVLHPNPEIEKNFITTRLSRMVRNALGVSHDQNDRPWDRLAQAEQKKSSLSSGRRANRRDGVRRVLNRDEQSRRQERLSSGKREDGQPTGTGSKKLKLVPMDDPRITELVAADQRWRDYASRLSSIDEQELVRGAAYKEPQLPGMAPEIDPSSRQTRSHVLNTGPRYVSFTDPKGKEHLYMLVVDRDYYENIFAYSVDALLKQKKEFDEGINDGKKRWNGEFLPDFRYVGKGAVVGTLSGERPRALKGKPVEGKETYTIDSIEVKKAHTRRGIGSAMLKFHRDVFPEADMHHSRALSEDGRGFAGATPIETLTLASGRRSQTYKPLEKLIKKMDQDGSGWMLEDDEREGRLDEIERMFGSTAREAIELWWTGRDDITYSLREEIESGKLGQNSKALLELVANSPVPRDPLYRGMRLSPEKVQEIRDGKRVIFPLGATSRSKSSASEYARDAGLSYDSGVMFEIEGAPAFPMHHFSMIDEDELLISGEFDVVDEGIQVVGYGKQIPLFKLRKRESSLSSGRRSAERIGISPQREARLSSAARQRTETIIKQLDEVGVDLDKPGRKARPLLDSEEILALQKLVFVPELDPAYIPYIDKHIKNGKTDLDILRMAYVEGRYSSNPYGFRLALSRKIAEQRGDTELVKDIDDFVANIKAMTPEEFLEEYRRSASEFVPSFDSRPHIYTRNAKEIVDSGTYETIHQGRETQGGTWSKRWEALPVRRAADKIWLDYPDVEDPELDKLRPVSSMVVSKHFANARRDQLRKLYGDDVEIMHDYAIGEAASQHALTGGTPSGSSNLEAYGSRVLILRPETAERTIAVRGDSIADTGSYARGGRLTELSEGGEDAAEFFNPLSVMFAVSTGRDDTLASPTMSSTARYNEGLVAGGVDRGDILAIVADPENLRITPVQKTTSRGLTANGLITSLIEAAQTRDRFQDEYGIDVVVDSFRFPLSTVEPFNPQMTRKWVETQIETGRMTGVSSGDVIKDDGTTPYEALLRYTLIDTKRGPQRLEEFDHPDMPDDDEDREQLLASLLTDELDRIDQRLRQQPAGFSPGRRAASRSDHLDIEVDPFITSLKDTIEKAIDKPDTEPESTFSIMRSLVDRMARAANNPTYDTHTERADEFISEHRQKFKTKLESTFEKVRKSIYAKAPKPESEDENTAIALVVEATMRSLLFELADNPDMPRSELTSLARRTLEQQDFAGIKGSTKMSPARVGEWMDGMDTDAIVEYAILHLQIKALRQWQDIGYIALRNYANCLAKGGSKNTCDTKMDSFVISGDIDARPDRSIGEPTEYMLTDRPIRNFSMRPLVSQYAEIMNEVSKKFATKTNNSGIVYRGITKAPEDRQAAMLSPFFDTMVQNLKPGTVFSSSTFSGTSTSPYFATQFSNIDITSDSILFVIRTPKNTRYVAGSDYEDELILQPNQRFRILTVSGGKMKFGDTEVADKYIVEVEALPVDAEIDESGVVRLASGRRADSGDTGNSPNGKLSSGASTESTARDIQQLDNFEEATGVRLYGSHIAVNGKVIPTVRSQLVVTTKPNGDVEYHLEASIPGKEENLHSLTVHTHSRTGKTFYGLALSKNARTSENLDTFDIGEFTTNIDKHLANAFEFPPSPDKGEWEIMSDQAAVAGFLDEWSRRGVLRSVSVQQYSPGAGFGEANNYLYDPVANTYVSSNYAYDEETGTYRERYAALDDK